MPGPIALLNIVVSANTAAANANLARTQAQLKATAATANSSAMATAGAWQKAGQKMSSIGKTMTRTISLPAAAVGAVSIKMAMDFETSMMKIQNLAGTSETTMKRFREEVLKLAPSVGKSPQELAEALYFIRSSGIKAADSMSVLTATAKASAIGLGSTVTVADAVTSAMNAYRRSNLSAAEATNILAKAVQYGKGEPEELAKSIGRVIPVASKLKVPFNDVGASLAGLTLQGLDAAEATTALRAVFLAVLKPGSQASQQLASVGLTAEGLRKVLAEKGTLAMLQLLAERFKGNEEAMARVFPNVRGLVGAFNLTGDSAKRNAQIFQGMKDKTDIVSIGFQRLSETDAFKMRQSLAKLQETAIELGTTLLPIVAKMAGAFSGLLNIISKIPGGVEILVAAIVVGPLVRLIGVIWQGVAAWKAYSAAQAAAAGASALGAAAKGGAAAGGGAAGGGLLAKLGLGGAGGAAGGAAAGGGMSALVAGGIIASPLLAGYLGSKIGKGQNVSEQLKGGNEAVKQLQEYLALTGKISVAEFQRIRAVDLRLEQGKAVTHQERVQMDIMAAHAAGIKAEEVRFRDLGATAQMATQRYTQAQESLLAKADKNWHGMGKTIYAVMAGVNAAIGRGVQPMQALSQGYQKLANAAIKQMNKTGEATDAQVRYINSLIDQSRRLAGLPPIPGGFITPPSKTHGPLQPGKRGESGQQVIHRQAGGHLPGPMAGDKIPLLAEGGEFMVNAKATKRFLPYLEAMNQAVPRFAQGGILGVKGQFRGILPNSPLDDSDAAALNIALAAARKYARKLPMQGGRGGMGGGNATWQAIDALASQWGLHISSGFRPGSITSSGNLSYHAQRGPGGRSRATDYADSAHMMLIFARKMAKRYGSRLAELIHTPLGFAIKNGQRVAPYAAADHYDHVHVAMQKGGLIPSGSWNRDQLTTLAKYVGMKNPAVMAAIAMAESTGNPKARGAAGEYGLWQILPSTWTGIGGRGNPLDPIKNARTAKKIADRYSLTSQWTTYRSGAYQRYLGGHVKPGLLAALRGQTGTTGKTSATTKGTNGTTFGLEGGQLSQGTQDYLQNLADMANARNESINALYGESNLQALQRYQTGMAQNPLLGIPTPGMPSLQAMLSTSLGPQDFYSPSKEFQGLLPRSTNELKRGKKSSHHTHVHVYIDGKELKSGVEKVTRRQSRKGNRRLPSGRG